MKTRNFAAKQTGAFTLVELLTVMTIIAILAGLVLGTFKMVQDKAARNRAETEIKAMEAALENYKADNGTFVVIDGVTDVLNPGSATLAYTGSTYSSSSKELYKALSGDADADGNLDSTGKQYMEFKPNQLAVTKDPTSGKVTAVNAIIDPWSNSYGYSTINQKDSTKGVNPTFDLWSTSGQVAATTDAKAKWIKNW